MRVPTERQYERLLNLGSGAAGLSCNKRDTEPLLRHGWVTAEWRPPFYQWVRITPDGLRALAEAVERYGLPDLGPNPTVPRRVCADCGSALYRIVAVTADEVIAGARA
jgi:hypothetical protein